MRDVCWLLVARLYDPHLSPTELRPLTLDASDQKTLSNPCSPALSKSVWSPNCFYAPHNRFTGN